MLRAGAVGLRVCFICIVPNFLLAEAQKDFLLWILADSVVALLAYFGAQMLM